MDGLSICSVRKLLICHDLPGAAEVCDQAPAKSMHTRTNSKSESPSTILAGETGFPSSADWLLDRIPPGGIVGAFPSQVRISEELFLSTCVTRLVH